MKTKMPYGQAATIAAKYIEAFRPYCTRIEVAGSIRRAKPEVGDIEIVAIPVVTANKDMFGQTLNEHSLVDDHIIRLASDLGAVLQKNGTRYKKLALMEGISLDLFLVQPPAQWGVIFALRTGPADFSAKLVTPRRKGGFLPAWAQIQDGRMIKRETGEEVQTSEEVDFFNRLDLPYIRPVDRQ